MGFSAKYRCLSISIKLMLGFDIAKSAGTASKTKGPHTCHKICTKCTLCSTCNVMIVLIEFRDCQLTGASFAYFVTLHLNPYGSRLVQLHLSIYIYMH